MNAEVNKKSGFDKQHKMTKKQFIATYGSLIGLILLVIIITVIRPRFLSPANLRNVFRNASINGLLAIGMTFVVLTGGIDLSVGAVMGCAGMYSAYFAQSVLGYPALMAVLIGLLVGVAFGIFNGICIAYLKVPAFVGTLGAMSIADGLKFLLTDAKPIPNLSDSFKAIGGGSIGFLPTPCLIMIIVLVVWNAAHVSGINTKKIICSVYILTGVLSALAGIIMTARVTSGVTSTGDGYETDAIAAVVIGGTSLAGGKGRLWGTIVGILIMQFLSTGLDMLGVNAYYQMLVKGFVVIGAVMLDGLSSD